MLFKPVIIIIIMIKNSAPFILFTGWILLLKYKRRFPLVLNLLVLFWKLRIWVSLLHTRRARAETLYIPSRSSLSSFFLSLAASFSSAILSAQSSPTPITAIHRAFRIWYTHFGATIGGQQTCFELLNRSWFRKWAVVLIGLHSRYSAETDLIAREISSMQFSS